MRCFPDKFLIFCDSLFNNLAVFSEVFSDYFWLLQVYLLKTGKRKTLLI